MAIRDVVIVTEALKKSNNSPNEDVKQLLEKTSFFGDINKFSTDFKKLSIKPLFITGLKNILKNIKENTNENNLPIISQNNNLSNELSSTIINASKFISMNIVKVGKLLNDTLLNNTNENTNENNLPIILQPINKGERENSIEKLILNATNVMLLAKNLQTKLYPFENNAINTKENELEYDTSTQLTYQNTENKNNIESENKWVQMINVLLNLFKGLKNSLNKLGEYIKEGFNFINKKLLSIWDNIKGFFGKFKIDKEEIIALIIITLPMIINFIKTHFAGFFNFLSETLKTLKRGIELMITPKFWVDSFQWIKNNISNAVNSFVDSIRNILPSWMGGYSEEEKREQEKQQMLKNEAQYKRDLFIQSQKSNEQLLTNYNKLSKFQYSGNERLNISLSAINEELIKRYNKGQISNLEMPTELKKQSQLNLNLQKQLDTLKNISKEQQITTSQPNNIINNSPTTSQSTQNIINNYITQSPSIVGKF